MLRVVDKAFVDFVGHDEQIVLVCELRDGIQLRPREHLSNRVVRRIEHDHLRVRVASVADHTSRQASCMAMITSSPGFTNAVNAAYCPLFAPLVTTISVSVSSSIL